MLELAVVGDVVLEDGEVLDDAWIGIKIGLKGKGRLAVGADADFIVFNPSETHILDEATMNYRVGWEPLPRSRSVGTSADCLPWRSRSHTMITESQRSPLDNSLSLPRMTSAITWYGWVTLALALFLSIPSQASAQGLEGAWHLDSYEGGGNVGPTTGQLLIVDGRWTLLYRMEEAEGSTAGRAHGGPYDVSGDTLNFVLEWSMQTVGGRPVVSSEPSLNPTQFILAGDQLTLRYRGGGVIRFTRVRAPEE